MPEVRSQNEFIVVVKTTFGDVGSNFGAVPKRSRVKRVVAAFDTTHTGTSAVEIEKNGSSIGRTFDVGAVTAPAVVTFPIPPFAGSGQPSNEFAVGDVLSLNSNGVGAGGVAYVAIVMEELAENRP